MPRYYVMMCQWEEEGDDIAMTTDSYDDAVDYLENSLHLSKLDNEETWFNSAEKFWIEETE